jgi:hypothetical protein
VVAGFRPSVDATPSQAGELDALIRSQVGDKKVTSEFEDTHRSGPNSSTLSGARADATVQGRVP